MSIAQQNAAKLRRWVDPTQNGADATGATYSTSAFVAALADGRPIKLPSGTFKLTALTKGLVAGGDLVIEGEGPEATRLLFDSGHGLTITYDGDTTGQGDTTSITIKGLSIETVGAGAGDALRIINTETAVVNDSEETICIDAVNISGSSGSYYWSNGIYLENVSYSQISRLFIDDGARRTVGIYINAPGATYSSVNTQINGYTSREVISAIKVRGRTEGVIVNQMVVVGCDYGVDWVATLGGGEGKKPLLSLDGTHIDTHGTAVRATDVSQIVTSSCLFYIRNSSTTAAYGFDLQATTGISSENHVLNATIMGLNDRTASLAVGVRCGSNVFGVTYSGTMENIGTCVSTVAANRTQVAPGSRLVGYNTRTVGMYDVGTEAGGSGGGVSVDGTLQQEVNGSDVYDRDMYREQLRSGSFVHTAGAADENVTRTLTRPFRTDTSNLVACWGADHSGVLIFPVLASCTASDLVFRCEGMTPATDYRINYIAYGY